MLQIDHVYEFLYQEIFYNFNLYYLKNGVPELKENIEISDIMLFTPGCHSQNKIFFYDQEPLLAGVTDKYLNLFNFPNGYTCDQLLKMHQESTMPYGLNGTSDFEINFYLNNLKSLYKRGVLVVSEHSNLLELYKQQYNFKVLYYFFHGFAAIDWYRGYYALNYNKNAIKSYNYDYISFNRIINGDRSYRIYFITLLAKFKLLNQGRISFGVTGNKFDNWQTEVNNPCTNLSKQAQQAANQYLTNSVTNLIIDGPEISGSASASILRNVVSLFYLDNDPADVDAFWHVVTETVFYHDKLHLTEKIFKPIVMKQPFMLLAAPGNLAYLKRYGFKTFNGIIDESYDLIQDNDQRVEAVVDQLAWYCSLSTEEKQQVIEAIAPIVEYNFHHFYGEFKHIITRELLDNTKTLFKEIGYDDSTVAYDDVYKVLTN